MITETMPLNEWPIELLKCLQMDLEYVLIKEPKAISTLMIWSAVNKAIKDVEFEQERRAEHVMDKRYEGDGNFADNH